MQLFQVPIIPFKDWNCYGLLKDNATQTQFESAWYSKPVIFNQGVQAGATVTTTPLYQITLSAASDPDFLRVETDSPELIKLTLDGQPVVTVYVGGNIPPGAMEVRVDASGKGVIEFNTQDAGKAVSGVYAWIKN